MPFQIKPGVTIVANASASDVGSGGFTDIIADVKVDDVHIAGVPVTFSVSGGGALSSQLGGTDENGRATVLYQAPAEGTGSAVITATAELNGTSYPAK